MQARGDVVAALVQTSERGQQIVFGEIRGSVVPKHLVHALPVLRSPHFSDAGLLERVTPEIFLDRGQGFARGALAPVMRSRIEDVQGHLRNA